MLSVPVLREILRLARATALPCHRAAMKLLIDFFNNRDRFQSKRYLYIAPSSPNASETPEETTARETLLFEFEKLIEVQK